MNPEVVIKSFGPLTILGCLKQTVSHNHKERADNNNNNNKVAGVSGKFTESLRVLVALL